MNCEEIVVPAPWGEIAVRLWGNQQNLPILMFHGIMDNVGTFDRLIPFLTKNYHYICVDLPGHGKSTHFPSKSIINTVDYLLVFTIISKFFQKEKYTIIGHSYGGQLANLYAQLYPEKVEKLILLDVMFFLPLEIENMKKVLRKIHELYFKTMDKLEIAEALPEYDYEEALEKVASIRKYGELTKEAAKPILERMLKRHANGKISLLFDQRLKFLLNPLFNYETSLGIIKENVIECPILFLLSRDNEKLHQISLGKALDFYKGRKNVRVVFVEGSHDVHNIHPERVAPVLNNFLLNKCNL